MKFKPLSFFKIGMKLIFILFIFASTSFSQDSEADLKIRADKSYRSDNFVEASKHYAQLLAINKLDPFYNFRYGVCLIYNSRKKQDAIKHLIFASNDASTDPEVYFYLGRAYHLNYEFGEAIKYYNTYKSKVGSKLNVKLDVNRQIEMSENGKRLLASLNEIVVLEKIEIEASRFFDLYDLKNIGGSIIVNAQFQSKNDKKNKHTPIIHFPANPNTIFYSSYNDDEKRGKDIFIRKKLPDGSWSLPQTVYGDVNTAFDEDYPYMHPNGKYLYFCSKGHNSMGGFDVYRSKYDKEANTFGPVENLDFAISSPDDDLFYVVDSLDKNAYFASSRQSLDGKIYVYKVRVSEVPIQIAVIKSAFSSTVNPEFKKVSVEIYDFVTNAKIGTFNSNEKGNVLMTFPKGGKYEFQIRVNDNDEVFKSTINVPFLADFKPLKQKMIHEKTDAGETVRIVNLFDENVEDPQGTMTEIARVRSELNPNAQQFDLNAMDKSSENKEVYAQIGYAKQTDLEVKENINRLADNQENQTKNLKEVQQKAIDKVLENVKEISNLQAELKSTVALADSKLGDDKKMLVEKAASIVNELNSKEKESKLLIPYADSLENTIKNSQTEALKARTVANQISEAFDKKDYSLVAVKINENKAYILDLQKDKTVLASESLVNELVTKRDDIKKTTLKQKEFLDMKIRAKNELLDLDIKMAEAKTKDQPSIQKKIEDKQGEIKYTDEELKTIDSKLNTQKENLAKTEKKLTYLQEIINSKATTTSTNSSDAQKALLATDNQNARTLKAYVEEQSKTLGVDISAQTYTPKNTDNSNKNAVKKVSLNATEKEIASKLTPDYEKNIEAIAKDTQLTEEQKLKYTQKEEKYLKFQLSKEINATEEALKQNPKDAELTKKLVNLVKMNENLNNNILSFQVELEKKFPETNPEKKLSSAQLANRVKPNHFAKLMTLDDNNKLTENQKLDKAQSEDQEFIKLLSKEKDKLQRDFAKDPSDEMAKYELNLINELLAETDKRIEKRTMGMASFSISDTKVKDDYIAEKQDIKTDESKINDVKTLDNKTVDSKVTENKSIEKLPIKEKTQAEKDAELKALGIQVDKTTENKTVDNKKSNSFDTLNGSSRGNVSDNKTIDNKTIDTKTADNKTNDNKTINNKILDDKTSSSQIDFKNIVEISPDYEKKTNEIKSSSFLDKKQKQENLISEENILQKSADTKLSELEKLIQKNPTDTNLLNKKESILAIKQQSEDRENESKQLLQNEIKASIKKEDLLAEVDKIYSNEIKDNKQNLASEAKLQEKLTAKIATNDKKIALKEDLKLSAENQVLSELIEDSKLRTEQIKNPSLVNTESKTLDSKINDNKIENSSNVSNLDVIKTISPSFEKNTEAIKSSKSTSESSKQEKLIVEENKLQSLTDEKLKSLEKSIQKNPADTSLTNKKASYIAIKEASEKREIESKIVVQKEIKAATNKEDVLALADKKYNSEIRPNPEKVSEINQLNIKREEQLQVNLNIKKASNEKEIAINDDLKLKAENEILNELIEDSQNRVEVIKNPLYVKSQTKNQSDLTDKTETTTDKKVEIASNNDVSNQVVFEDPALKDLKTSEKSILDQLSNPSISKKDEKKLKEELILNQEKQIEITDKTSEGKINLVTKNKDLASKAVFANSSSLVDKSIFIQDTLALALAVRNETEINALQKELLKTKKDSRKEEIVKEIKDLQADNVKNLENISYSSQLLKDISSLQSVDAKATSLSLESKNSLVKRKGIISVDISEMKQEIEKLKTEQKSESDKAKKVRIIKEIENKEKQLSLLKLVLKNVEAELIVRINEENNNKIAVSSEKTNVNYTEEEKVSLSKNSNYSELKTAFEEKNLATKNKSTAYAELEIAKNEYNQAVSLLAKNSSDRNQQNVNNKLEIVVSKSKNLKDVDILEKEKLAIYQNLTKTENSLATLEKMFSDGIESNYVASTSKVADTKEMKTNNVSATVIPFKIFEVPQTESVSERVKIGADMPMGLVYRVQVGAFKRPLKSNLFTEFTPVTGEIIKTGVTRYITGYFSSLLTASDAKKSIRKFGYRDAFIVAYCDGKRISISEARRLQNAGLCVPSSEVESNSSNLATSTEEKKINSKEKTNQEKELKELGIKVVNTEVKEAKSIDSKVSDYNKGKNAVKAIAVETKLGLFYTVQIGAYNSPATTKQLKYTENVVSKKLADGKIRYSTGIFQSVAACMDTKNAVIQKGITDAFVTAYYNGDRITLAEAEKLLKEKGESILEKP